jgi:hypothetical protein
MRQETSYISFQIKISWKDYDKKWFYVTLLKPSSVEGKGLMPPMMQ